MIQKKPAKYFSGFYVIVIAIHFFSFFNNSD